MSTKDKWYLMTPHTVSSESEWRTGRLIDHSVLHHQKLGSHRFTKHLILLTIARNALPDFGFAGMYWRQLSGLNLAALRACAPSLGRWLNRDPIGESGGLNLYGYVGNNPISRRDPMGLFTDDQLNNNAASNEYGKNPKTVGAACEKGRKIADQVSNKFKLGVNDIRDARRHAEWGYRMAKDPDIGPEWAWDIGAGYEFVYGFFEPWNENLMDLHNNEEGINAAVENRRINENNFVIIDKTPAPPNSPTVITAPSNRHN